MTHLRFLFSTSLVVLAWVVTPLAADDEAGARALAAELQRKYDAVKDFSADFVHTYEGGVLRRTVSESGHLLVKKPGRMRWTYTKPEEKVFVSDGVRMYSYIPADRQVYVAHVSSQDEATTPALFLTGKGNLLEDFEIAAADPPESAGAGARALRLTPRIAERDYDTLVLVVDESSLALRMLIADDQQGGRSAFTFSKLRENIGVQDREFVFRIPRGVEVVTDGGK